MNTPLFIIKWTNYEYWPWWFFYIPVLPYWLWLSIKTRSLAFFTATNTNIEMGGFFGESKIDILNQIPTHYRPKTIYITSNNPVEAVQQNNFEFPVVAKPNIGERGFNVEKINSAAELATYHEAVSTEYIIQEFIDYSIELGVLFYRLPNHDKGLVTSITIKEFLTVTGDGKSTIVELMNQHTRARFQITAIINKLGEASKAVIAKGEKVLLEPIGNHCRGTRFINGNHLINEKLHAVFNTVTKDMAGFYYGRFDLKVKSIDDLYAGKNIRIMELNGASSEPGHIYDTSYGLINAYKNLMYHWNILADIAIQNRARGIKPVSFNAIVKTMYTHFIAN
ncbi:MAG: ATP-grasp domain-containing protein [Bacteroidetes bacterium]|nr:ATP-grasp domain-containing protein [Bacteroidota bacterium]